jgi:hypothetical protein
MLGSQAGWTRPPRHTVTQPLENDMSTTEIRVLSLDETGMVSGGKDVPGYVHCTWPTDGLWGPNKVCDQPATQAYINAFLKGVEQGKGKGQKQ